MARPRKDGIDYFPVNVSFFSNSCVESLIATHGCNAPSVYLFILCKAYEEKGYYFELKRTSTAVIAKNLLIDKEYVDAVISECLGLGLFDLGIYNDFKVLTSLDIQRNFQVACKARGKRRHIDVDPYLWLLEVRDTAAYISIGGVYGGAVEVQGEDVGVKKKRKSKGIVKTGTEIQYDYDELREVLTVDFSKYTNDVELEK